MLDLTFAGDLNDVVCLGAHPDDIEIGAAGTIAKLAATHPGSRFTFVILCGDDQRNAEAEASAIALLGERVNLIQGDFEDRFLPYRRPGDVKDFLVASLAGLDPDLVLAPQPEDKHQDHRFLADLAGQALRDHLILGYEIQKYDGDLGRPQVFVALDESVAAAKLDHLAANFSSQHEKPWYRPELFEAMLRVRGVEAGSGTEFAEAFYVSKARLG
jgi:LmbE family N-acetylglucosaminyl deacetylase